MPLRVRSRFAATGATAVCAVLTAALAGCGGAGSPAKTVVQAPATQTVAPQPTATAPSAVAPLTQRLRADVLVTATQPLSPAVVRQLDRLHISAATATIDVGTVRLNGHAVRAVAADPSQFRAFAPQGTAEITGVWETVARGEAIVSHATAKRLKLVLGGPITVYGLKRGSAVQTMRLGALATTLPGAEIVVKQSLARPLGLRPTTGVILSAGKADPAKLANAVRSVVGALAQIDLLSAPAANPTAFLTGTRAASAFGAFSYRYYPDGTIEPDAAWVRANIRFERVPFLGVIGCHRLMFKQLRGALNEIQARGLGGKIRSYDGCYVPRFIERNPNNSISLHTWGIAIDINAFENGLHQQSRQDPRVVQIFKKWGFTWGGDWTSPKDPMHFQLGALLD